MSQYVVIDLEMCRVSKIKRKQYRCTNEIIEIGAVLLNDSSEITDSFKTYVSPEYGRIDAFIEDLTGIKNENVASAPTLEDALTKFFAWLPEDAVMVAWSGSDAHQLERETHQKGIDFPQLDNLLAEAVDCQEMFGEKMDTKKSYRLSEALVIAGIEYDEGAHDALVDAHNTALLFAKILNDDEFILSPYYTNEEDKTSAYCPFADLLANFSVAV